MIRMDDVFSSMTAFRGSVLPSGRKARPSLLRRPIMRPNQTFGRDAEGAVLVVGAGPVGLTLALGLARYGVACRIIDRSPGPTAISRATELHARTLELLDALGLAHEFLAAGLVMREVPFFHEGRPVARLCVEGIDS